jgi:leucyl aminopeptidase (aminopeptidase T)
MEFKIGTEAHNTFLGLELANSARKLVEEVMLVKKKETVVITADTSSDWRVVQATANAVYCVAAEPVVILYETRPNVSMEPPSPVSGALKNADVWIEYSLSYILHSQAYKESLKGGCRYICLSGMDVLMMVRTIGKVNYLKIIGLGEALRALIGNANEVKIESPGGTDLIAYNQGRKVRLSGKLADTKGEPIMLGGQVSWCPVEETINGSLVFDGTLWPPDSLGKLKSPVKLILKEGIIKEIDGGYEAKIFGKWLSSFNDPNMYRLAHYSLGFNPGVTELTGRIVEDERLFGCIEFGIGSQGAQIMGKTFSAAAHTDGVVLMPSITLDGKPIEKEGKYLQRDLVKLCRDMSVLGY